MTWWWMMRWDDLDLMMDDGWWDSVSWEIEPWEPWGLWVYWHKFDQRSDRIRLIREPCQLDHCMSEHGGWEMGGGGYLWWGWIHGLDGLMIGGLWETIWWYSLWLGRIGGGLQDESIGRQECGQRVRLINRGRGSYYWRGGRACVRYPFWAWTC